MAEPEDTVDFTPKTPEEESGPYGIADDAPTPARATSRRIDVSESPRTARDGSGAGDDEAFDAGSEAEDGEGDDSLPPPISRPTNVNVWLVIAGVFGGLILLSWLAGASQLVLPDAKGNIAELGFGARLNGLGRTVVFVPLATLAAVFGLCTLAFVRQRPIGDVAGLFAKSLAIVCVSMMVWLVPSDIRILKQALHVLGFPAIGVALAIPIFRLHPRDALVAMTCALVGMLLLVLGSWVVVWSTT